MLAPARSSVILATVAVLVLASAFVVGYSGQAERFTPWTRSSSWSGGRYVPAAAISPGIEMAMVFIGSSTCGPSNADALPGWIDDIKLQVREQARARGAAFAAVGIARDRSVADGIEHLRRFGSFDEVITGRGWLNTGMLRYVWEDLPGRAATPQVLVVERRIVDRSSPAAAEAVVADERILVRKVGLREIERWTTSGAPIPRP